MIVVRTEHNELLICRQGGQTRQHIGSGQLLTIRLELKSLFPLFTARLPASFA